MSDLDALLARIEPEARAACANGRVADYIPALARVPSTKFGMAICFADGVERTLGDADEPFSIQSISKVFGLAFALDELGDALWDRVGREATGMRFNSMVLLEREEGRPRNPLINAGAIVVTDALMARKGRDWPRDFVQAIRALSGADAIGVDHEVYRSEDAHGDLNRAIAWFLRAKGNLRCDPTAVTEAYFSQCAVAMSCRDLARAGRFLLGSMPEAPLCRAPQFRRRIQAVMRICGLYDAAGDFAYRVGLPAKSGVGGGILAVSPGRYSVCVWSPALDAKGNSAAGQRALELLVEGLPAEA